MSEQADRHTLYQDSVQCPEVEIDFFTKTFKKLYGKKPLTMREDFCGTAFLSTEWAKSGKKRAAWGIDFHAPTLEWGRRHNLAKTKKRARERVHLIHANVLDVTEPKVDVVCAMNFSYLVFKERPELARYFSVAHQSLNDHGIFICELYGGTDAIVPIKEKRPVDGFTYVWEQADFNPITNETLCHIHFRFRDGSRLERAFTYDWRLWSIPEVRECLAQAGFSRVDVYWDPVTEDEDDDLSPIEYRLTEKEDNQAGWLVYFVAVK